MTPTNRLRFVERDVTVPFEPNFAKIKRIRVLQQWWVPDKAFSETDGEWRDVPLEIEE